MSRVSVTASQKPKPKTTFKFLRRDEGRLSYSANPETPRADDGLRTPSAGAGRERRDSRALREAIAYDMRNAKSHDPLGEVVIAVPRKALLTPTDSGAPTLVVDPPQQKQQFAAPERRSGGAAGGVSASSRRTPVKAQAEKRPEWVNPEIPAQRQEYRDPQLSSDRSKFADMNGAHQYGDRISPERNSGSAGRMPQQQQQQQQSLEYDQHPKYEGGTPRRAVPTTPGDGAHPRRYTEPAYEDYSAPQSEQNYFRRGGPVSSAGVGGGAASGGMGLRSREEETLMIQLEQEVRAAQEERAQYSQLKSQLDAEKRRFETYKFNVQQQLDDERAELDAAREKDMREARKGVKSIEERYKNVSTLLATEREASRKLMAENDSLRAQLEELTGTLRESQRSSKAEVARLRRDMDSLTHRNSELLTMTKERQLNALGERQQQQQRRPKSTVSSISPSREHSQPAAVIAAHRATALSVPRLEESLGEDVNQSGEQAPVVMDFTPRAEGEAAEARERRAAEMAERMKREEAEMQQRRLQRAREVEERKRKEAEDAAAREDLQQRKRQEEAKKTEEERKRQDEAASARRKESLAAARKRKEAEEQAAKAKERENLTATTAGTLAGEISSERKAAGHPVHTPRLQTGGVRKQRPAVSAHPKPQAKRIPTREEMIGDVEPMPTESAPSDTVVSQTAIGDNPNKREVLYRSGKREIHYANGTVKTVLPSGHTILQFTNKDVKCTYPTGKSTYWYDAAQTMHMQSPDGVQVFEFRATGQIERHKSNGSKEILYPDGIYKIVYPDGTDETVFPDE